jgi:hypothetical protein
VHLVKRPTATTFAVAGLLVLGASGCGKVADEVGEKAAENAIEASSGGNADIDIDGGEMSIETDEGTYTADGSGEVRIETADGSYVAGTGELPDGWPTQVRLPDDLEILTSSNIKGDGDQLLSVVGTTALDPDQVVELVVGGLDGWETVNTYDMGGDGFTNKTIQLTDGEDTLNLSAGRNAGESTTSVSYGYTVGGT